MNIELRAAEERDIPGIAAVWNLMIRETLSTFTSGEKSDDALRAWLQEKRAACLPVLVASCDGIFAGFATYGPFRSGPGYRHTMELTILVEDRVQGTGAAWTLLAGLEKHAGEAGIATLVAGMSGTNARAIAFHARAGYREVARMPGVGFKQGRWLDLVLMQKRL